MLLSDDDYQHSPGLVGEITRYIISTAPKPQPALAFSAALTAVATLKAHKVQTRSELRTNLYCLALAGSGAGKDYPSRAIKKIFKATGNDLLLTGEPASDSGLLKSLSVNNGRALLLWDEFGHALSALTGQKAGTHHRKIVETMLKLFSSAGTVYLGKEYANFDGRQSRKDIDQPNLSVYASTVPHRFFDSLNSDYIIDGFLPRWLVFEAENPDVDYREITAKQKEIPESILSQIIDLNYKPMTAGNGNLSMQTISPAIIHDDMGADFGSVAEYFEEQKRIYRNAKNHAMEAILARGYEHFCKISLTLSTGDTITKAEADFALRVVETSNKKLESLIKEHVSDNDRDKDSKKILNMIRNASNRGLTLSQITRKTQYIHKRIRKEIIEDLLEGGEVINFLLPGKGRKKIVFFHSDYVPAEYHRVED